MTTAPSASPNRTTPDAPGAAAPRVRYELPSWAFRQSRKRRLASKGR